METSFLQPLASYLAGDYILKPKPITWLVTGKRGVGKTRFCQQAASEFQQAGYQIGGVLSHAVFKNGNKIGIELEDLQTGKRRLLGSNQSLIEYGLKLGCWQLNQRVLAWGNERLRASGGCDVVFIDECGFLELVLGGGFTAGLILLDQQQYKLGIAVIRFELLPLVRARWPYARIIDPGRDTFCD